MSIGLKTGPGPEQTRAGLRQQGSELAFCSPLGFEIFRLKHTSEVKSPFCKNVFESHSQLVETSRSHFIFMTRLSYQQVEEMVQEVSQWLQLCCPNTKNIITTFNVTNVKLQPLLGLTRTSPTLIEAFELKFT